MKRRRPPKENKNLLGLCREGRTEDNKNSDSILSVLQCFSPGDLPPPRSHHSVYLLQAQLGCHPLPPPCLSFAPWIVEYWPLWDTSFQLQHCHQPAVHHSLPPASLLQGSSFLSSQDQEVRSVLQPKIFYRASKC